jgi:transcription factor-like protein
MKGLANLVIGLCNERSLETKLRSTPRSPSGTSPYVPSRQADHDFSNFTPAPCSTLTMYWRGRTWSPSRQFSPVPCTHSGPLQAHPYGQFKDWQVGSPRSALTSTPRNLSGLALRQCIELGYHRDVKKINLSSSVLKLELRKRAFWCAYQMDCVSSINLGLPLGLPIHELDTEVSMAKAYICHPRTLTTRHTSCHSMSMTPVCPSKGLRACLVNHRATP